MRRILLAIAFLSAAGAASAQTVDTTEAQSATQICNTYTVPKLELLRNNVKLLDETGRWLGT